MAHGDTYAIQSFLQYLLQCTDTKVVLITRCNVCEEQYQKYLKRAMRCHTNIIFMIPQNNNTNIGLAVSLAGVIQRSSKGDEIMIGQMKMNQSRKVLQLLRGGTIK